MPCAGYRTYLPMVVLPCPPFPYVGMYVRIACRHHTLLPYSTRCIRMYLSLSIYHTYEYMPTGR